MKEPMDRVTVRVPGTTANLGPGFDTLGVALRIYNHVTLVSNGRSGMRLVSAVDEAGRDAAEAMIGEAARVFFRRTHLTPIGCDVGLRGDVPAARGLGSSVTVRLGVVAGLNEMLGAGLSREELLDLVAGLERHPDNAAPAIYGGFTAAGCVGDAIRCVRFPVSRRASFVTLIPDFEVKTSEARTLVPDSLSRVDTVHNLNRAALITAAFAAGDLNVLKGLFEDRLHQPFREPLIPQLSRVIRAGEKAGAIGGWLSGSGSTIICLALDGAVRVGDAMLRQMPGSELRILGADSGGMRVRVERALGA
jgi:homoserine kinase